MDQDSWREYVELGEIASHGQIHLIFPLQTAVLINFVMILQLLD